MNFLLDLARPARGALVVTMFLLVAASLVGFASLGGDDETNEVEATTGEAAARTVATVEEANSSERTGLSLASRADRSPDGSQSDSSGAGLALGLRAAMGSQPQLTLPQQPTTSVPATTAAPTTTVAPSTTAPATTTTTAAPAPTEATEASSEGESDGQAKTEPTSNPDGWVDAGHGVFVPKVLLAIRFCESRDNYTAANPSSSARGAYQFLTGSWDAYGHRARYGVSTADQATPAQQDEAALITWERSGTTPWNASRHCWG